MNCRASSPSEHVLTLSLEIFQATTIYRLSMPLWVKQCAYVPLTMQLVDMGLRLLLSRGFFGRKLFTSPNMTIDNRNSVLMVWGPKLKFITIAQFVLSDDFQPMPWDVYSSHVSEARNASDRRRHSTLSVTMIYSLSRQHFGEKRRGGQDPGGRSSLWNFGLLPRVCGGNNKTVSLCIPTVFFCILQAVLE